MLNFTHQQLQRLATAAIMVLIVALGASAQYTVSSFNGDVKIKHSGSVTPAEKNMRIGAFDIIIIGTGSQVTIFDKASSSEYTRSEAGEISPNNLVFEAKKSARSNLSNVHRNVGLGKGTAEEGKMYVEKGKVTLALDEYDPAAGEVQIDGGVLAKYIVAAVAAGKVDGKFPTDVATTDEGDKLRFGLVNTTAEPLYINALKAIKVDDGSGRCTFRISELGQPVGCYVILPGYGIERTGAGPARQGERHFLIATHYYYSIDELLEKLEAESLAAAGRTPGAVPELPIYMVEF